MLRQRRRVAVAGPGLYRRRDRGIPGSPSGCWGLACCSPVPRGLTRSQPCCCSGASCSSSPPAAPSFYRKGFPASARFTPSWLMSVGTVLLRPCGFASLLYRHVGDPSLWLHVSAHGPRAASAPCAPWETSSTCWRWSGMAHLLAPCAWPPANRGRGALPCPWRLVMRAGGRPRLPGPARGQSPCCSTQAGGPSSCTQGPGSSWMVMGSRRWPSPRGGAAPGSSRAL